MSWTGSGSRRSGGKTDMSDSFCEHVGLFLKLLTLTNKVSVN